MTSVLYFVEHNISPVYGCDTSQVFKSRLAALSWARTEATGRWRVIRLETNRAAIARGGRS